MKRPWWSEISIMLFTSSLCSLIIHEGFWEEIISDLMETHQSLTDVPLHNLQLATSQTHRKTLLCKIPFTISNRLVWLSQYTNQGKLYLSFPIRLFKAGFTLTGVCLLKYIPSLPLPDSRHYSLPPLILPVVVSIGSPGLFFFTPLPLLTPSSSLISLWNVQKSGLLCYSCHFCSVYTQIHYICTYILKGYSSPKN